MRVRSALWAAIAAVLFVPSLSTAARADVQIIGAGSTFDNPFFSRAFYEYMHSGQGVTVNYQSVGSGAGIQQFIQKVVDFGATDVPMNSKEMAAAVAAGGPVVQVPVALGGVAIAYNVPGVSTHLKLSAKALANIFLGHITNWNDPAIAALNPGVSFPNLPIVVVHRADGSGTTYIFTDYLSHVSSEWSKNVGTGKTVNWSAPSAVGAKGTEMVAGQVSNVPGAIGYVELAYAMQNNIAYAEIQNKSGAFVLPTTASVQAAAGQKPGVNPSDFSIVDEGGAATYPIVGYSWAMLWKNQPDPTKGQQLVNLFRWVVTTGQSFAQKVDYVALPATVQAEADRALASIHV